MANAHLGHTTWNPSGAPLSIGRRSGMYIFHTKWTAKYLARALLFLHTLAHKDGKVLFLSTRAKYSPFVEKAASQLNQSCLSSKWVGGTLTNWSQMHTTITLTHAFLARFETFVSKNQLAFPKYTRAKRRFENFHSTLPDVLIVLNPAENAIAIREANLLSIPVVALVDSSTSFEGITYPIPANDDSCEMVHFFLHKVVQTMTLE